MKMLLTSGGLTNQILKNKFIELCNKNSKDIKVAFINTASKVEKDKSYMEKDLKNLRDTGVEKIDLIDISKPINQWEPIILDADVVWVEGGNTFYLLDQLRINNLVEKFKAIIKDKFYVGVSAGSIIVTPTIDIANVEPADINNVGMTDFSALSLVDFEVSPHTPNYVPIENVEKYAQKSENKIYAYDDNAAIYTTGSATEIVGEGFCKILN